ncbi:hypothetical protein BLNAU_14687 [Blattamonas nauphoetae]|uniref:Protein kinase domain-containing protein n=1 Tax=Blattamonas nauphoetae TaxID=2049346 RepID=A0ABQ9XI94_9EUKA|nr:hypothetical protein BLNAU_14687 [Blattamonas nauphoetae]
MNRGGSLLSHNTSFTQCHTPSRSYPNTQTDYDGQHFTSRTEFMFAERATNIFSLCTFDGCYSDYEGGAIGGFVMNLSLQVKQCSFKRCHSDSEGGAISCMSDGDTTEAKLSESFFVGCSADFRGGGAVSIMMIHLLAISDCVFLDSFSNGYSAGAIILFSPFYSTAEHPVSNCLFENCQQVNNEDELNGGGALFFRFDPTLQLSYLQFRGCSAITGLGHDIQVNGHMFDPDIFTFCETDSPGKNRIVMQFLSGDQQKIDYSDILTKPAKVVAVTELSEDHTSSVATFTLTLSNSITGDVLILLSNENGNRVQGTDEAPNIGRVLKFTFSDSNTSTFTGPVGEDGLFQGDLSVYEVVNAYLNRHLFSNKYLTSASCDVDYNQMDVDITLEGLNVPTGEYTVTLNGTITLTAAFTLDESGKSIGRGTKSIGTLEDHLQLQSHYSVTSVTSKDALNILIAPGGSFSVPAIPPILKTSCRVGSGTDHAWVQLTGLNIAAGTYSVKLKDVAFSFEVTFNDGSDGTRQVLSTEASVRLFGAGSMLTFGVEYTLESVTDTSTSNPVDLYGSTISFSTPQPTDRIVGIGTMDFTDNQKNEVSISLSGADMTTTEYFIKTEPSSVLNDHKMSVVFTEQSGKLVGKVYSATGNAVPLDFGETYEILSITDSNEDPVLFFDKLTFYVPTEPARIESTSSVLNGPKTEVTVTLTGRELFSATMTVKLTNPNTNREFTKSLSYVGSTSCTVNFPVAQTETENELVFGGSYDVVSIVSSDGEKSFVVNSGVKIEVPSAPIINSITSDLSLNCTHFKISFSGISLPTAGSLVASISASISLDLNCENGVWTTGWLLNGTNGMLMNTSYSVSQVASGENKMILNKDTFKTAEGPTLSPNPTVTLKTGDLNSVVLSLVGQRMPVPPTVPSFDLIVVESEGSTEEITIPVSFSTNEIGSGEVGVYKSGKLKYSTSYSVVRMTSTAVSVSIPSAVTFTTPAAPTRIISATCDLDAETGKSAEIVLNGMSFPKSQLFTLTVFELDDSKEKTGSAIELSSSFASDGSSTLHSLTSQIYKNDEAKLKYQTSYEITKLYIENVKTIVDDLARFVVPPEPSRLTTVTDPAVHSEKDTEVSVTLSGIKLTGVFTVTLKSNQSETPINVSVTFSGSSGDLKGVLYSKLDPSPVNMMYDTKYEIVSMEDSNKKPVFVEDGLSLTTMKEPTRVVSVLISRYENDEKEVVLLMDGRKLDVLKKYEVKLSPGNVVVDLEYAEGKWEGRVGVRGSDEAGTGLLYGLTYTVDEVVISNTLTSVHHDDISFDVKIEPARIISTSPALNGAKTAVNVTLTGSKLFSTTMTVKVKNPSTSRVFTSSLSYVDSTSCTVNFPVAQTETENELVFGGSYDVVSIVSSDGEKSFVVNSGVKIEVPSAPIINSITSDLSLNCTHFEISFSGNSLPTSGSLIASISPSITLDLSYVDGKWTTGWLLNGTDGMLMNTSYSVTKIASGENEMILNVKTFTTAEGPTLSSNPTVTLKDDDLNSIVLSLAGQRMPVSSDVESFYLIVVESGSTTEITIAVSFSTNEIGSGEAVVYKSGTLKYSTSYSVVRMTSTTVSVSIPSAVTFTTPAAPTRIISATCDLDAETGKSAEIVLNGVSFPKSKSFTLTVYELDDSNVKTGNGIELSSSFASDGSSTLHTLSSLIYENSTAELKFGKTYEITKLDIDNIKTIVDDLARFSVPSEPSRLIKTDLVPDPGMNKSTLTLTTSQLIPNEKYTVALSGTPTQHSTTDSVHTLDFDVDGAPSITKVLNLYPDATLRFNHLYEVTSMKMKSSSTPIFIESDKCTFSTPEEPLRIVDGGGRLNSERTEAVVTLTGLALKAGLYSFTLTHPTAGNTRTITGSLNLDGNIECNHTVEAGNANRLIFGETYTITSAALNDKSILFNSDINISVPFPPKVTGASFNFSNALNTTCTVTLTGSDLDLQGDYFIALSDGPTLTIVFDESEQAISPILLIGFPGKLQFNTTYTVVSIKKKGNDADIVHVEGNVFFKTGSTPTTLTMNVDEKDGSISSDCGDSVNPCSSVDIAWDIASILLISKVTLKVEQSVSQSQPWSVSKDGFLVLTKDQISGPTLRIPSTAWMDEKEGMIVVDGGILEIRDISVLIENGSDSFVFVFGKEGSVKLFSSSITGIQTTANSDESEDVCRWSSGILRLVNCTTLLDNAKLTHHSQGAINMEDGSLTVELSTFHDNTPNHQNFPSFRRNVYCTDSATIKIESLFGGDGSKDYPSPWISLNDCNMTGEHAQPDTPLFIPTLSNDSTSTLNKTNKAFSIEMKGSTLIPCGLWLEIVEVKKDKTEGTSEKVELTSDLCSSISESSISLELAQSLLSPLKDSLEWQGRLIFGNNVTSAASFIIQKSSADRISQSVRENMKWWLPLVIVLVSLALIVIVIVVICCRRRKTKKMERKDIASTELDTEMVEKLEEDKDRDSFAQNITTHRQLNTYGIPAEPDSLGSSTIKSDELPSTNAEAVEVLVCGEDNKVEIVQKKETLFEKLHGMNKQKVDAVAVGKEIAKGLRHLSKAEMFSVSLAKWTPHWIVLDSKDRVCIRLNEETGLQVDKSGKAITIDDGERWRAPEQSNGQLGVNEEQVSVFRLGLVLLEMKTGLIPFGEIDATNASRQLCAGLLPPHPHVDEDFMSIVRDCLAINPNERPLLVKLEERLDQYVSSRKMENNTQTATGGKTEAFHSRPTVEFAH